MDTAEKTWTEWRMRWLADQIGIERLRSAQVVLPTEEFFPEPYSGTLENAIHLLHRIGGFLGVETKNLELEVCRDTQLPGAAGHYDRREKTVIRIAERQLTGATWLIATLAHELAHEILLGGGLLTVEVSDHEWVTDLLPVFLGVGVFAANATVTEDHGRDGQWSWWSIGKQGYLPARIFGYAFALFAFMRGELDPVWAKHLRPDALSALRGGLKFLRKSDDSLFHPNSIRAKRGPLSTAELAEALRGGSPTFRLVSLWETRDRNITDSEVISAVTACLADVDPDVSEAAGRTLAVLGPAAQPAAAQLVNTLKAGSDKARAGAACALGMLRCESAIVVPELCSLLVEQNRNLVAEAAQALRRYGRNAESAVPQLLAAMTHALRECDDEFIAVLAGALMAISTNPERQVRAYFSDEDSEFLQRTLEAIEEQRGLAQAPSPFQG